MKLFLLFFCFVLCGVSFSQSWDANFYDKNVLYDNADLLQLTEYEKLKLKSQELERNRSFYNDNSDPYYLDIPIIDYNKSANSKLGPSDDSVNYLFSNVVSQVSGNIVTSNIVTQNKFLFIDF
jgi:hypothetical protein